MMRKVEYNAFIKKSAKKLLKFILSRKYFPQSIINTLIILKNIKERLNFLHPYFSKEEKKIIKNFNLESFKLLHSKFPIPPSVQYDFHNLRFRTAMIFNNLLAYKVVLKEKTLLDLGAGIGENLVFAGDYNIAKAVGIDYSSQKFNKFIEENRHKLSEKNLSIISFLEKDVHEEIFDENSFDIIMSNNSFEHFQHPDRVLKNMWSVCKVGGYVNINFGPLFYSVKGAHRYGYTGVPYFQNLFSNDVVFEFLYNYLNIDNKRNRYTGEEITVDDLYPEMNKWKLEEFENLFLNNSDWEIIQLKRLYNYQYLWFVRMFSLQFKKFNERDLFTSALIIILKKHNN